MRDVPPRWQRSDTAARRTPGCGAAAPARRARHRQPSDRDGANRRCTLGCGPPCGCGCTRRRRLLMLTRRTLLGAGIAGVALRAAAAAPRTAARVVVVGGGFGGATCARYLKRSARDLDVTLVEPTAKFVTCPMSNAVLSGIRSPESIEFDYSGLERDGIARVPRAATSIDAHARTVTLDGGDILHYDRLVVSPGVDFAWDVIEGASADVAQRMPHAWKAGEQTRLLKDQLVAMRQGGVFVMSI